MHEAVIAPEAPAAIPGAPVDEEDRSTRGGGPLPFIAIGLLLLGLALVAVVAGAHPRSPVTFPTNAAIEDRWGIRITQVAVTADGGLVDIRFLVLDPDKALAMMENVDNLPVLHPEGSRTTIASVAQMAARHDLNPGQTYFLLYRNNGGALRPGGRLSLSFGDLVLQHVVAQ